MVKTYMKYAVMLPVFVGVFGYVPLSWAFPNLINYIFGQPFEETVVVLAVKKHLGKSSARCVYDIYTREFASFSPSSFCIAERLQLGDSVILTGKRSWFGVNIINYSQAPRTSGIEGSH